jgi:hypothetical protein
MKEKNWRKAPDLCLFLPPPSLGMCLKNLFMLQIG